jgi:hypothetical protein
MGNNDRSHRPFRHNPTRGEMKESKNPKTVGKEGANLRSDGDFLSFFPSSLPSIPFHSFLSFFLSFLCFFLRFFSFFPSLPGPRFADSRGREAWTDSSRLERKQGGHVPYTVGTYCGGG